MIEETEALTDIRRRYRRGDDVSLEEFEQLNAFWQQRPRAILVPSIAARQTIQKNTHIPGQLYCSFCGKHVPYCKATVGTITDIRVFTSMVNAMGPDEIPRYVELKDVRANVDKIVACEDDALKIKARVDKDGRVTNCVKFDYI